MLTAGTLGAINAFWQEQSLLPFRTQKAKALFFYFLIEWEFYKRTEHRREFLADLFWPEMDKKAGLENLRQTLYIIRSRFKKVAGQDFLLSSKFTVNKNQSLKISLDLTQLLSTEVFDLVKLPEVRHIPLHDLVIYDCEPFYEWLINFQAEIQQLSIEKIGKAIEYQKALQNWPAVESLASIYLAQDVMLDNNLFFQLARVALKQRNQLQAARWLGQAGLEYKETKLWLEREESNLEKAVEEEKIAPRIAVLPFKELQQDVTGISLGLVEDMVSFLCKYRELEVVPTFSVIQFQGSDKSLERIAFELRVNYLFTGTLRYINGAYKINIQLINCKKHNIDWSASLISSDIDSVSMQQDLTSHLHDALKKNLLVSDSEMQESYVPIPEAYDWYLQGWSAYYRGTPETTQRAKECFAKAIELDPDYRRAYLGILITVGSLASWWGDKKMTEVLDEYKWAQQQAAKDKSLHADLMSLNGWARMWLWDLQGAEKDFKYALSRKSNIAFSWGGYAHALNMLGRHQEAYDVAQQGLYNDPAYIQGCFIFAECNLLLGKLEDAEKICKAALKQQPDLHSGITVYIWVLMLQGKYKEAIAAGESCLKRTKRRPYFVIGRLAQAYVADKQMDKARNLLSEMEERNQKGEKGFPYFMALVHQNMGNTAKALEILEKHVDDYSTDYLWLKVQPEFKEIHENPRFKKLIDKVFAVKKEDVLQF